MKPHTTGLVFGGTASPAWMWALIRLSRTSGVWLKKSMPWTSATIDMALFASLIVNVAVPNDDRGELSSNIGVTVPGSWLFSIGIVNTVAASPLDADARTITGTASVQRRRSMWDLLPRNGPSTLGTTACDVKWCRPARTTTSPSRARDHHAQ